MAVCEILPDIYQITMPTPFPVGDVHAYLLCGEPLTLLDTGLCHLPSEQAMRAGLAEIGVATADLQQIVISHSHLDHFGLARRLQQESGAGVLAHPAACAKIADLNGFVMQATAWADDLLALAGLPDDQHGWVKVFYGVIPQMADDEVREAGRLFHIGQMGGFEHLQAGVRDGCGQVLAVGRGRRGVPQASDHQGRRRDQARDRPQIHVADGGVTAKAG